MQLAYLEKVCAMLRSVAFRVVLHVVVMTRLFYVLCSRTIYTKFLHKPLCDVANCVKLKVKQEKDKWRGTSH
jgi:hypothetical protein